MVCFRYIIVNTLHKGDKDYYYYNKFIHYYIMKKLASIFILISTYELKIMSPFPSITGRLKKMDTETCNLVIYNCGSTHP